jgi:hypothetical protein
MDLEEGFAAGLTTQTTNGSDSPRIPFPSSAVKENPGQGIKTNASDGVY